MSQRPHESSPSASSRVDVVADHYVEAYAALDPVAATLAGIAGHDHELPDFSPEGFAAVAELSRATLRSLEEAEAETDGRSPLTGTATDRVTLAAMRERLHLEIELIDAGERTRALNVLESPPQQIRDSFDLMATDSIEDWAVLAARLAAVPAAVQGYRESLRDSAAHGRVAARRQVEKVATQCATYGARDGFFRRLAASAQVDGTAPPAALAGDLARGADAAAVAYAELGHHLRESLLPEAPAIDAVGRDRYALASRLHVGTTLDLEETYQWGLEELARIEDEMAAVSTGITPGADVRTAMADLDRDPGRIIEGAARFRDWMQDLSDRTVSALAGTHFDIPEPVRRLDCRIAPTSTGAIYYTAPSEDFSRPGAMWWSVPEGVTTFSTWREVTTVFHEGVPGHHLQIGQTAFRSDTLNRWRRTLSWVPGHGEGWALYAERLMAELGHLDDPGDRLGMLDGQALRAARVVVDIGVHLQLPVPRDLSGSGSPRWDAAQAWTFLRTHTRTPDPILVFELDRYLGWPGQAPAYKVGERFWLELRERARRSEGAAFDLTGFHRRALDLGSVGLDVLSEALRPAPAP